MLALTAPVRHSTGSPSRSDWQEKDIKFIQIRRRKVKLSLFEDDVILYIEILKDSTRKLFEVINEIQ